MQYENHPGGLSNDELLWLYHVISMNRPRAIQAGGSRPLHLLS